MGKRGYSVAIVALGVALWAGPASSQLELPECGQECPEGTRRASFDVVVSGQGGVVVGASCETYCEPIVTCLAPAVPVITKDSYACEPLAGFVSYEEDALVDWSFADLWANPNAQCSNGEKDLYEGDVDCGGPLCEPCGVGRTCAKTPTTHETDCAGGLPCSWGLCGGYHAPETLAGLTDVVPVVGKGFIAEQGEWLVVARDNPPRVALLRPLADTLEPASEVELSELPVGVILTQDFAADGAIVIGAALPGAQEIVLLTQSTPNVWEETSVPLPETPVAFQMYGQSQVVYATGAVDRFDPVSGTLSPYLAASYGATDLLIASGTYLVTAAGAYFHRGYGYDWDPIRLSEDPVAGIALGNADNKARSDLFTLRADLSQLDILMLDGTSPEFADMHVTEVLSVPLPEAHYRDIAAPDRYQAKLVTDEAVVWVHGLATNLPEVVVITDYGGWDRLIPVGVPNPDLILVREGEIAIMRNPLE